MAGPGGPSCCSRLPSPVKRRYCAAERQGLQGTRRKPCAALWQPPGAPEPRVQPTNSAFPLAVRDGPPKRKQIGSHFHIRSQGPSASSGQYSGEALEAQPLQSWAPYTLQPCFASTFPPPSTPARSRGLHTPLRSRSPPSPWLGEPLSPLPRFGPRGAWQDLRGRKKDVGLLIPLAPLHDGL